MNLTKITTIVALSACAIAENPMAATANVIPTLEPSVEMQATDSIVQLENATIRSIAQPETLAQTPEVLTPEVLTPETVAAATVAAAQSIAAPLELAVEPAVIDRTAIRIANRRIADESPISVRPIGSHIQVGTQDIPPMTDLPKFISLPPESSLPANLKYPIVFGQERNSTILTASPITDTMTDPVWSRRMEDLAAYKAAYSENLKAWSGSVAQCMNQKPKLYVLQLLEDKKLPPIQLPVYFNGKEAKNGEKATMGKEGTIVQNKDGVSVCGM